MNRTSSKTLAWDVSEVFRILNQKFNPFQISHVRRGRAVTNDPKIL